MIFIQVRTAIMAASIIPIIAGYALARLFDAYLKKREPVTALIGLVSVMAIISPSVVSTMAKPILPAAAGGALAQSADCRKYDSVIALNEAPAGLILNHFNFGPSVLWVTHHDVLSAGYHRSATSMTNSIVPFRLNEPELREYISESEATYLLLCRDFNYRSDFVSSLASGAQTDWLRRVPLTDENQMLFEVLLE